MPNVFTNTDKVAAASLKHLVNNLVFVKKINQKYASTFKAPESVGESIRIRVPFNPKQTRSGATASITAFNEGYKTLSINQQKGIDVSFSSLEKELDIKELNDRVLSKEVPNLAAAIESDVMGRALPSVANAVFGTAGALTRVAVRNAKARLQQNLVPVNLNDLCFLANPDDEADFLESTSVLFNDQATIGKEYKDGSMGRALGFQWMTSNLIPVYATGTNATRTVNLAANVTEGDAELSLSGLDNSTTVVKGEIIEVAGVYDVNYQTKARQAFLKQFVVKANVDVSGTGTVTVAVDPIYVGSTTAGLQNVSALPTAGSGNVVFKGAGSSTYAQNLAFHPDFYTVAFADPRVPGDKEAGQKFMKDGIGIRYVEWFDGSNDNYIHRLDSYYGDIDLWSQWGTRVIGL